MEVVKHNLHRNEKVYIYMHICCIANWKQVVDGLFDDIKQSGLYEKVIEIRCFLFQKILRET